MSTTAEIRCVLIRTGATQLLLPNATISEVLSYSVPDPIPGAPAWLPGRLRWRGWRLPLVAFATLSGQGDDTAGLGNKVVVLKALGGDPHLPYLALSTQGFPRLVTVSAAQLRQPDGAHDTAPLPFAIRAHVRLGEEVAQIPDLDALERAVREVVG
ncbi:chemotaxis protein CheW [Luteimonas sp. TWI1416]|uniref:chemotaxis protein CheW n=1 Tax=unclassified Luteimonas TaxID=2629088 RepID=UPI0032080AEE